MSAPRKPLAVDRRDIAIIREADHFTAALFLGVGKYARDEAKTLPEIKAAAAQLEASHPGRRAMIYAINKAGRSALVTSDLESIMEDVIGKSYTSKFAAKRAYDRAGLMPDEALIEKEGSGFIIRAVGKQAPSAPKPPADERVAHLASRSKEAGKILGAVMALKSPPPAPAKAAPKARAQAKANAATPTQKAAADGYTDWRTDPRFAADWKKAQAGKLVAAPDFSKPTHAGYRGKLAQLEAMAKAGDLKGLRDFPIEPVSTTRRALERYRQCAVEALRAKAKSA